jgi:hypothetical protein
MPRQKRSNVRDRIYSSQNEATDAGTIEARRLRLYQIRIYRVTMRTRWGEKVHFTYRLNGEKYPRFGYMHMGTLTIRE